MQFLTQATINLKIITNETATSGYAASGGNSTLAIVAGATSTVLLATALLGDENKRTEILELKDKIKDLEAPSNDPK